MKNLFVSLLLVFVSAQAMAAELRLLSGETATIQANQTTRVSCEGGSNGGGGNSDCEALVNGLKSLVNSCTSSGYGSAACMDKYWPTFKQNNPGCAYGAISVCIDACTASGYGSAACADRCAK